MKAEDNPFPYITLVEQASAPATPAAGKAKIWRGTDNKDYVLDDTGASTEFPGAGGSGAFVGAKAYRSAAYSLVDNALTPMPWDAEDYDTNTFHDNTTNPSRFTIPTGYAGKYAIKANIGVSVGSVTYTRFIVLLTKNGSVIRGGRVESNFGTSSFPMLTVTTDVDVAVGDYLECAYLQISGASRAFDTTDCAMSIAKIG
jgi:hypothetical protein